MIKHLFWDNWPFERVDGLGRVAHPAVKDPANPLLAPDLPWEHGNVTLYGSVVKPPDGPFQLWYSVIEPRWHILLAYAESDDGIAWRKPELDVYTHEGQRTNIVFADNPHGPSILYDAEDPRPDWRYKMVCGAVPDGFVRAYRSADGIHWLPAAPEPIILNNPDCPMSLVRRPDGAYACHHRIPGGGRRIGRSESDDFAHWRGGRLVLEPGPDDPPQFQMYGLGATTYGDYEIGTLWDYATDPDDASRGKMRGRQQSEFVYSRSGWAWHRPAPRQPLLGAGMARAWDSGNVQPASAPVFLDDEIRYYYASSDVRHDRRWELTPGSFGVGLARLRPDGWLSLRASDVPATVLTRPFSLAAPGLRVNADIAPGGVLRVELLDEAAHPIPGFEIESCLPLTGDAVDHVVRWRDDPDPAPLLAGRIRWRIEATRADVYAVWFPDGDEDGRYWRFRSGV